MADLAKIPCPSKRHVMPYGRLDCEKPRGHDDWAHIGGSVTDPFHTAIRRQRDVVVTCTWRTKEEA